MLHDARCCTVRWMSNSRSHCGVKMWGNWIVSWAVHAESSASGRNLKSSFTFQLISLYRCADGQLSFYALGKEFPPWVSPLFWRCERKDWNPLITCLEQAGSAFDVGRATWVKFGLHVGNINTHTHTHTHWKMYNITIIICIIYLVHLSILHVQ
jgi:hypothetical protein